MGSRAYLVPFVGNEQNRLFTEHQRRGTAKEIRCHDGRSRIDRSRAIDDGWSIGSGVRHPRRIAESRDTALEPLPDFLLRQVTADEHHPAVAFFAVLPGPLMVAV